MFVRGIILKSKGSSASPVALAKKKGQGGNMRFFVNYRKLNYALRKLYSLPDIDDTQDGLRHATLRS